MLEALRGEKFQRANRWAKKHSPRHNMRGRNKHHMTNACKGGKSVPSNLLLMKKDRHATLHKVFRNMSWEEIGDALYSIFGQRNPQKCYEIVQRVSRMKGRVA